MEILVGILVWACANWGLGFGSAVAALQPFYTAGNAGLDFSDQSLRLLDLVANCGRNLPGHFGENPACFLSDRRRLFPDVSDGLLHAFMYFPGNFFHAGYFLLHVGIYGDLMNFIFRSRQRCIDTWCNALEKTA